MSVNKAILIGRLGKDPELRYTPNGTAVASFTLATNERWKGQDGQSNERTTWHNIVVWGRQAENVKEYIEGRIQNRSYDDKDGNKRFISEVVAQSVQFLGGRDSGVADSSDSQAPADEPPAVPPDAGGSNDDDLPF